MKKYCKFFKDIKDGEDTIFNKNEKYLVTHEDEKGYYFDEHKLFTKEGKEYATAIAKSHENELFSVVNME